MTYEDASRNDSAEPIAPAKARWTAAIALGVAALPHFFLKRPVALYLDGDTTAWLGLAIWVPTFLAAVAIFAGVTLGERAVEAATDSMDVRAAAGSSVPIVVLVALAYLNFDGYQHVGSWSEVALAGGVYAAVFGLGAIFWQGLLQDRALSPLGRPVRLGLVVAAGVAVFAPFALSHDWSTVAHLLVQYAVVYGALAALFEIGLSTLACMGVGALMGLVWAWTHQMTFF